MQSRGNLSTYFSFFRIQVLVPKTRAMFRQRECLEASLDRGLNNFLKGTTGVTTKLT
jgi:hypothetical protein